MFRYEVRARCRELIQEFAWRPPVFVFVASLVWKR
jgi:hypothetical protein